MAPPIQRQYHLQHPGSCETTQPNKLFFPSQADLSWDAWSKLVRFSATSRDTSGDCQDLAAKRKSSRLLSSLENLPAEITSLIFDGLVSLTDGNRGKHERVTAEDILALGLTSSTMFAHCVQHITLMSSRASAGPWVDTEIACIGDFVTRLPPGFTEQGLAPKITWTGRSHQRPNLLETRLWKCSAWLTYRNEEILFGPEIWLSVFDDKTRIPKAGWDGVVTREPRQILSRITGPAAGMIGHRPATGWILRNLTRRKFVKLLPPRIDGKKKAVVPCLVDHLGEEEVKLDDALLMRICWTTNGYQRAVRWKNSDCWAGDRFEIVHCGLDIMATGNEGWKDVTEQVASETIDSKK
ncbi:MAG: hypothetical protein Q9212_006975, partial [Teloschistes hypoglaucus]